ncbi:MAG: hypothetical protein DRJ51_07615 [Thermoprotei archaeon]|nr:MAG: hypothetical protein DRJ51_07615 [Thermoprotei archaeon]
MRMREEPEWLRKFRERALSLIDKLPEPKYGARIDLEALSVERELREYDESSPVVSKALKRLHFTMKEERPFLLQVNDFLRKKYAERLSQLGILAEDIDTAVRKYEWLKDYWFKAFPMALNKLTAFHAAYSRGGFVLRVKEGVKLKEPIQMCFIVSSSSYAQLPHNIIIAEPYSEVHILTGCIAPRGTRYSLHSGLTEVYVGEGARVFSIMIEIWPEYVHARPLKAVKVDKGGTYIGSVIVLEPGASYQAFPTAILMGDMSSVTAKTVVTARGNSEVDVGEAAFLLGRECRAILVTRAVAFDSATVKERIRARGRGWRSKAYLECSGLILGDKAKIFAVPELEAISKDVELYHESSIGRVGENELMYLMSRGFEEDEAISMMIRGFLDPGLSDLPAPLRIQVESILERVAIEGL